MDHEAILQKIEAGWSLTNRGSGWWLSSPHVPYKKTDKKQIRDSDVDALEKEGKIVIELPYNTAKARLA